MKIGTQTTKTTATKEKTLIEPGRYVGKIKGVYQNELKSGKGTSVKVLIQTANGSVYYPMNVFHSNAVHQEIERKKLNTLRKAVGLTTALSLTSFDSSFNFASTEKELVGKELNLLVEIEENDGFPARNIVKQISAR